MMVLTLRLKPIVIVYKGNVRSIEGLEAFTPQAIILILSDPEVV